MDHPYISVIIPCLNEELFLPHLLKNLNCQTFTDFEIIVIDGNSEDKTVQVAQKYKAKFPLYVHTTTTRNVSFQRNLGAKKSHGEILVFFDADTQIPKNYLKTIAHTFKSKPIDFLTTYIRVKSLKPVEKIYASLSNLVFEIGKVSKTGYSFGSMQAVTRQAFFAVKGYDIKTKFREDQQLFQKLYQKNYRYLLLKKPRYIFSMRRFQVEGAFKPLLQQLTINADIFIHGYRNKSSKKYQMGGKRYSSK